MCLVACHQYLSFLLWTFFMHSPSKAASCGTNAFVHQWWLSQSSGLYVGTQKMHICRFEVYMELCVPFFLLLLLLIALCIYFLCCISSRRSNSNMTCYLSGCACVQQHESIDSLETNDAIVCCCCIYSWAWPFFCIFNFKYHQHHIYVCCAMRISSISSHKSGTRLWKFHFSSKKSEMETDSQRESLWEG